MPGVEIPVSKIGCTRMPLKIHLSIPRPGETASPNRVRGRGRTLCGGGRRRRMSVGMADPPGTCSPPPPRVVRNGGSRALRRCWNHESNESYESLIFQSGSKAPGRGAGGVSAAAAEQGQSPQRTKQGGGVWFGDDGDGHKAILAASDGVSAEVVTRHGVVVIEPP